MIVSYSVKVKMNNKHIKRYIGLGYVCKVNEIIDVKIEHLTKGSSAKILAKCEICNNRFFIESWDNHCPDFFNIFIHELTSLSITKSP